MLVRQVGHRVDRVEIAGVHLAGVRDDDRRRSVQPGQAPLERIQVEAASCDPA